jgi:hypothetical protein
MKKTKFILRTLSLLFFILPPTYFVYTRSAGASMVLKINIGGCFVFALGILLANRFYLAGVSKKWQGMVIQWQADLKVEPDGEKRSSLRACIGHYENRLLALKVPLPAAIIAGTYFFLKAVESAAASMAAMLGICSAFWAGGAALLFLANRIGTRRKRNAG